MDYAYLVREDSGPVCGFSLWLGASKNKVRFMSLSTTFIIYPLLVKKLVIRLKAAGIIL
jgi:hypothetical protein